MSAATAPDTNSSNDIQRAARRFGVTSFRPGQRELIDAVLQGRDAIGVLPTGGGKSLCYQLPALLLPKPTVIVSPLIALVQDQVAHLDHRHGPNPAKPGARSAVATWILPRAPDQALCCRCGTINTGCSQNSRMWRVRLPM